MLGTDGRVVEARGNRVRERNLSCRVLQKIRICSLQHSGRAAAKACRVFAQLRAASASFNSDQLNLLVLDKFVKNADGIRSAAYTRDDRFGKLALGVDESAPASHDR